MADPVSAGAGLVGVIGLAIQITQLVVRFGTDWKDAPENIKSFMNELGTLQTVLSVTNTNILLNSDFAAAFQNRPSVLLSQLGPNALPTTDTNLMLETCRKGLESLLKELKKSGQGHRLGWERLKTALKSKGTQESVENLCRQCQTLNNMVSIDTAVLGATTYKEVREAREEQKEVSSVIRSEVDKSNKRQETQEQQQERRAILDWLTPIDDAAQQHDFISRRQEGTGQWLLDSAEFQTWLTADAGTLFCPGIPGAGKTILASVVVDELTKSASTNPTIGIAYIYCNLRRQEEQKINDLLMSLLKQLVEGQRSMPGCIKDLHDLYLRKQTRPSLDEISRSVQAVIGIYFRAFIVIDALDECQFSDGCREEFMSRLFDLQRKCKMSVFATSRPMSSVEKAFDGKPALEIRASENDVRRYLHGHMSRLPDFVKRKHDLQGEIETEIIKVVDGMFLLAKLHLDSLIGKSTPKALRATLKNMARGSGAYDSAYNDAMKRIKCQLEDQEELAIQVLLWITCAKRQLSTAELQHALAVEVGEPSLDEENLPDVEDMVSVCAGLVTVDEESDVIRLVHYTTQEYFERTQQRWFPDAQTSITELCVAYLSFDVFESGRCQNDYDFEQQLESYKLYDYASHNWGHHARESSILCPGVMDFLWTRGLMDSSSQALMASKHKWREYSREVPEEFTGLHLAACFGLQDTVQILASSDNFEVRDSWGGMPLSYAARNGHTAAVRLLLDKGADVNAADGNQHTPLRSASVDGHIEVVRLLLDRGADVNAADFRKFTPLHSASEGGHIEVVLLLLDKGADVNAADCDDCTPLYEASKQGHIEVVRMLLDRGADVNAADESIKKPLNAASEEGHSGVVRLLLDKGADIDADNGYSYTPLGMASRSGHVEVVRLLLDNGDDMDAASAAPFTPLHTASIGGHVELVRLLLEKGADMYATDTNGDTPLFTARQFGHVEVAKLLEEADIKASRRQQGVLKVY